MSCQFRYVIAPEPQTVSLRLFYDEDATPRAEVIGLSIHSRSAPTVALSAAMSP